jgi:hypothetical protein
MISFLKFTNWFYFDNFSLVTNAGKIIRNHTFCIDNRHFSLILPNQHEVLVELEQETGVADSFECFILDKTLSHNNIDFVLHLTDKD